MEEDETPEDRLEAALERIAKSIDGPRRAVQSAEASPATAEAAARLDRIITTLREALGTASRK